MTLPDDRKTPQVGETVREGGLALLTAGQAVRAKDGSIWRTIETPHGKRWHTVDRRFGWYGGGQTRGEVALMVLGPLTLLSAADASVGDDLYRFACPTCDVMLLVYATPDRSLALPDVDEWRGSPVTCVVCGGPTDALGVVGTVGRDLP